MIKTLKFTNGTELQTGTLYCVASNYSKHAMEMGGEIPHAPAIFIKPPAAYIESRDKIRLPDMSKIVHHEVELVVVIGKECISISKEDADDYIAGYGIGIDVTMRDVQAEAKKEGKPWAVAKGFVTSAPISKIIPKSQINGNNPDFYLELKINGEIRQKGSTADMERKPDVLIEFLSKVFTLQPGDCIFTGTPEGVGQITSGDKLLADLGGLACLEVTVE